MLSGLSFWCGALCFVNVLWWSEAMDCQGTARYRLTFLAEWTSQSHRDFPSCCSPHFSNLIGCSHNASYVMWTPGILATPGVKNVAELGRTRALEGELDVQIQKKNVHRRYTGGGISRGTGSVSINNIEVTSNYPLVSFISMIAPSPDWFVGVHDFDLCNETSGRWLNSRARDLPLYDSGTDSGARFRSADNITSPPVKIHLLTNNTEGSLKGDTPVKRFGTFTFVKTFDSFPSIKQTPTSNIPTTNTTNFAHSFQHLELINVIVLSATFVVSFV